MSYMGPRANPEQTPSNTYNVDVGFSVPPVLLHRFAPIELLYLLKWD